MRPEPILDTLSIYLKSHSSIPGWFTDESAAMWDCLLAFQKAQHIKGDAFEIGVYHGKSAAMTCLHLRADEKMVLVDPYRLETVAPMLAAIKPQQIICHPCLSSRVPRAELVALAGRCRWVHIDGEHTGSACWHDLTLADQLLEDRGVVVIDDFLSPRYPQVAAAVFNYLQNHPFSFRMFLCGFFKAYLARPRSAHLYLSMVRDEAEQHLNRHGFAERITFFKTTVPDDYNCFGMGRYEGRSMIGLDWDKDRILI